jgi:hypothetical protein
MLIYDRSCCGANCDCKELRMVCEDFWNDVANLKNGELKKVSNLNLVNYKCLFF